MTPRRTRRGAQAPGGDQDLNLTLTPPANTATPTRAHQRYEAAHAAYLAALDEVQRTNAEMRAASEELHRTLVLSQPLRDVLDHQVRDYIWRRPPTARRLAKGTHRPLAEVQRELDAMVAEGIVRTIGTGYAAVAS